MGRQIEGFIPPIATPMKDGKVDIASLERLVDYLSPHVQGFLVGGSVGENPSLTREERFLIAETVSRRKRPEHILAISVADNSLPNCAEYAAVASRLGADIAVVLCPTYYANNRQMLCSFVAAVADASDIPLCLYDNPQASGVQLSVEDILAMHQAAPRLEHVKVTDPDSEKVAALKKRSDMVVHGGDDIVLWHMLARGAEGAMVALPMIYPEESSTFWREWSEGDRTVARTYYSRFAPFIHMAVGGPDYVQVIKAVLHHRGVIDTPEVRVPLLPLDERRQAEILAAL
jgi:dihydrodipicolinate synthase/N-acetylneuraminate lyase